MDRRTRSIFALALVVVIAVTGGAALILGGSGTSTPAPSSSSFMRGVVVGVDARSPTDVRSFDLRRADGGIITFSLAELQNGSEFPPGHLAEHQLTGSQIFVYYREGADGDLLATRLEDAP